MSVAERMDKSIESFKSQLNGLRTGRANPELLNSVVVEYYGAPTPLNQVASISTPEARVLMLNIFDANAVKDVERAIQASNLGLTPRTEGNIIHIRLPELTEDRRKELVKVAKKHAEEARVSIRNIRRDEIDNIKKQEKNKEVTEDESKQLQDEIQKVTDEKVAHIDSLSAAKEKDILTI
jgi:ribosome recycling factor